MSNVQYKKEEKNTHVSTLYQLFDPKLIFRYKQCFEKADLKEITVMNH